MRAAPNPCSPWSTFRRSGAPRPTFGPSHSPGPPAIAAVTTLWISVATASIHMDISGPSPCPSRVMLNGMSSNDVAAATATTIPNILQLSLRPASSTPTLAVCACASVFSGPPSNASLPIGSGYVYCGLFIRIFSFHIQVRFSSRPFLTRCGVHHSATPTNRIATATTATTVKTTLRLELGSSFRSLPPTLRARRAARA